MQYQLKTRQICFLFIALMPITKLFTLPSVLALSAREDMWISAVINLALDLITLSLLCLACQKTEKTFFELLEDGFGNVGAKIIMTVYTLYFLLKAFIPLQEQEEFVKLSLYINMPTDLFFLPFFVVSFILCLKPLRVFGRASDVVWIFTLVGYFLLIFLSVSNVEWQALLPVGAQGAQSVIKGSCKSFNWWGDCAYMLFFIGNFKSGKKASIKIILSYLFSGLIVVLAMVFFWETFTSIAHRQQFAMTELSKYTTVINNTGRFDYVGIIFILFSCVFSLSLPLYFASLLLNQVFNLKHKWICPLIVNLSMLISMLLLNQYMVSISAFFESIMSPVFFIMGNLLPILTLCLTSKRSSNENVKA